MLILVCPVIFLVPAILGGLLTFSGDYKGNLLARLAGVLTLKPFVATPLVFLLALFGFPSEPFPLEPLLLILPGAILTLVLIIMFNDVFKDDWALPRIGLLLVLDGLRWLNVGFGTMVYSRAISHADSNSYGSVDTMILVGVLLPTVFALVAWWIGRSAQARLQPTKA